jgi:hypothetical protein
LFGQLISRQRVEDFVAVLLEFGVSVVKHDAHPVSVFINLGHDLLKAFVVPVIRAQTTHSFTELIVLLYFIDDVRSKSKHLQWQAGEEVSTVLTFPRLFKQLPHTLLDEAILFLLGLGHDEGVEHLVDFRDGDEVYLAVDLCETQCLGLLERAFVE